MFAKNFQKEIKVTSPEEIWLHDHLEKIYSINKGTTKEMLTRLIEKLLKVSLKKLRDSGMMDDPIISITILATENEEEGSYLQLIQEKYEKVGDATILYDSFEGRHELHAAIGNSDFWKIVNH